MSRLRIAVLVLVDKGVLIRGTKQFEAGESDRYVAESLERQVRRVAIETYVNLDGLLRMIDAEKPDLVFNLTQRADGDRQKDGHICALLELRGVPYTGAGARGLMLGRDKAVSKLIAAQEGFKSPGFFVSPTRAPRAPANPALPMVVKPRYGDASEGISQASLVRTREALIRRIAYLRRCGAEEAICEEFVSGREMIVPVLGKRMIPPREFTVGRKSAGTPQLASANFKYDREYRRRWQVRCEFAELTERERRRLQELTLRTSEALEMRDYGRLDVRLTPEGEWAFLEANPNPGLAPYGTSFAGTWGGVDYDSMIREITLAALKRGRG